MWKGPLMLVWIRISSRKKVFPSSNECLRRIKVYLSRETDLIIVVYAFKYLIAFGERKMKAPQVMPRCEDTEPTNAYYRHIYESHASSPAWMSFPSPLPLVTIAILVHLWCQMSSAQEPCISIHFHLHGPYFALHNWGLSSVS